MKKLCTVLCLLFPLVIHAQYTAATKNQALSALSSGQLGSKLPQSVFLTREMQQLIKDSLARFDSLQMSRLDTIDSTNDRSNSKKKRQEPTAYESILKGTVINPDSLLGRLEIFGYSLFQRSRVNSFGDRKQVAVPGDYPIESGDEIVVMMWGRINEEYRLSVDRNGTINIPRIGPMSVGGLPFKIMQKNVINRLQSIEGVQASITMGALSEIRVFIVGEVGQPGQYILSPLTNVTNALFEADGFTKQGSIRNVQLVRNGKMIGTFDFYDFLISGNNFSAIRLNTDDVIVVPVIKKMAAIVGNVRRNALYELKERTSLQELVELGGGFTPSAWVNRIQIQRFIANQYQTVEDLKVTSAKKLPDILIEDGDIVKIFPVVELDRNAIYLLGNVKRPGKYAYQEPMKISDILTSYELLLPETYPHFATLRRLSPPLYTEEIITFNLHDVLTNPKSPDNIALQPLDKIVVYPHHFFEPQRIVSIAGSINKPGEYSIAKNMRIKDLILEAGGLDDRASDERGELYKRRIEKDTVITKKILFNVVQAMQNDPNHNHLLTKDDFVFIRKKKGWEERKTITIRGEVTYPGTYIVLEGEALGSVLRRAGGFKNDAFLNAAIYTRVSIKEIERKRFEDYGNQLESDITKIVGELAASGRSGPELQQLLTQQQSALEKIRRMKPLGRIVIDFTETKKYERVQIEDQDTLLIPPKTSTVSVIGEVFNPSTFVLDNKNAKSGFYIQLAGGFKEEANSSNTYIIKANGSVRTRNMVNINRYPLEPGDAIVVPRKIPKGPSQMKSILEALQPIFSISSSTIGIAKDLVEMNSILQKGN